MAIIGYGIIAYVVVVFLAGAMSALFGSMPTEIEHEPRQRPKKKKKEPEFFCLDCGIPYHDEYWNYDGDDLRCPVCNSKRYDYN